MANQGTWTNQVCLCSSTTCFPCQERKQGLRSNFWDWWSLHLPGLGPLFKQRSQELWLQFWQIQIMSKIIQVYLRDPVWLVATCSWICRLNILQRYWLGRILSLKVFHLMRKEDSYLLQVWVYEDHFELGTSLIANGRLIYLLFLEDALKPVILIGQK